MATSDGFHFRVHLPEAVDPAACPTGSIALAVIVRDCCRGLVNFKSHGVRRKLRRQANIVIRNGVGSFRTIHEANVAKRLSGLLVYVPFEIRAIVRFFFTF